MVINILIEVTVCCCNRWLLLKIACCQVDFRMLLVTIELDETSCVTVLCGSYFFQKQKLYVSFPVIRMFAVRLDFDSILLHDCSLQPLMAETR